MGKKLTLLGIIIAVVDDLGPRPKAWYPSEYFTNLSLIHNSAVKSFSIMIGEKSYREKPLHELTCFGILPFKDIKAVGFIHFFGIEAPQKRKGVRPEIPTTITLLFPEPFQNEVCQKSSQIHSYLERENKTFQPFIYDESPDSQNLLPIYKKLITFLDTL